MASTEGDKVSDTQASQGFMTMTKFKSDVICTLAALLPFIADTMHIFLTAIVGFPTSQGRENCIGMEYIFSPMVHTPYVCAVDAGWMIFLEAGVLLCWHPSYKVQMLNIVFGITASMYFLPIGVYGFLAWQPPIPIFLGIVLGANYYWRVNYLHEGCMGKYGKIFNALFGFWLFFSVVMVISMLVVDPHITQSKQIYKDTSEANSKGVPWPPENKFPDGVPTQSDRLDKATAELEQVFVFPLIVVIVFLAAITGIPLYTVANVSENETESTSLLP